MRSSLPLYKQSHGYSCGPAALMMVMSDVRKDTMMNIQLEDSLWEDANLIESRATSAHGLALAALKRGLKAKIVTDTNGIPFAQRLKQHFPAINMKKMKDGFRRTKGKATSIGLKEIRGTVDLEMIRKELDKGRYPIVLISTRLMWELRPIPHWIVVTGIDEKEISIANPEHGRMERYGSKRFSRHIGFDGQTCLLSIFD